ncbi:MAG TPA: hypothetical protein VEM95_06660, partial [Thermoplasmata archaeon]|nr:hypothetical protein [Thermoplasmata archaeon]
SPGNTFQPPTDALGVVVNGYLVLCLGVALAESLATWQGPSGRRPAAFPIVLGVVALIITGPIYGFELVVLGVTSFTGTNLATPVAGALFAFAMLRTNPLPFRGRVPEGGRRVPWTVPGGTYLVEETRSKYAESLFLAAAYETHALGILSDPETASFTGIETVRLPPGPQCPSVLAATVAEFTERHPSGAVLVDDASYAVTNGGLRETVREVGRVAAARPPGARLIVSLSKLTDVEREAFREIPGTHLTPPDVDVELAAILDAHLGAAGDQLMRAAIARGKRVEDLSIPDVPHVRDYLLASIADLRGPSDDATQSGWRRICEGLASDLEALWRTPPMEPPPARTIAKESEGDSFLVRAAEVLVSPTGGAADEPPSRSRLPLGGAVRDAFLDSLGPAGDSVYRQVLARLRKEPEALGPDDLPRIMKLAQDAVRDLFGAIDVDDAKRDLAARTQRLRAQLKGLAGGDG